MTINTQVVVLHSYTHLLSNHDFNTFDISSVPVNEAEKETIQVVKFLIHRFYTRFNRRILRDVVTAKITFKNLSDCLNSLLLHSFPYGIDWSHLIGYMVYLVEVTVCFVKNDSTENALDFAWSILWNNFEKYLDVWIQEQGGWPTLVKIAVDKCCI